MAERQELPSTERLLALIEAMGGQPVLMLVDLVADRFLSGTPKRISREAPVLILRYEGETLAPGGGANAVANVAALGGRPLAAGVVGDDASGRELLAALAALGVETEGVLVHPGYRTPTKTRVLAGARHAVQQQIVRYDVEDALVLSPEERQALAARLGAVAGRARVAVLSDYGYGAVEPGLLPRVREALLPGGTVLCDSRYRLADYAGLDGATPNEEEAEALLGWAVDDDRARLERGGRALLDRLGARFLLVTRGSRGMSLFDASGSAHLPVHGTDQVADVTGAGDTVIGAFALAIAAGASPLEASLLADYAGGVVVMKRGTATLSRDELAAAVSADAGPLAGLSWGG